jgi:exopolysaccharide/PEP-CTERM locus tyrosine autokinase
MVDVEALRGLGYLPESERDREFADHYRRIKRPLLKAAFGNAAPVPADERSIVMVTSALPGEGKTFTSINLALSLAREREISVLLVDADLLRPKVSGIFGVKGERGLTDALRDDNLAVESLVRVTNIPGFSLLPAGPPVDEGSELLSSDRMREIMKSLSRHGPRRILLLDSPPLLVTSEARTLVGAAGQVVLVVRAGVTPRRAVLDSIDMFAKNQLGGIVLNEVRMGKMQGYYGYGTYGSSGDDNSPKP